jgi:hypothetical protein
MNIVVEGLDKIFEILNIFVVFGSSWNDPIAQAYFRSHTGKRVVGASSERLRIVFTG